VSDDIRFSCILPTYNRCDVVEQTLRQLIALDYPDDAYEVIVADNSTDGTPGMVERVGAGSPVPIRLLSSANRLPAVKRNEAIRMARGRYVVLMNDDLWVRPDFLLEHERAQRATTVPTAVLGHVEQSKQMDQTPFIEWYQPFAYHELVGRAGVPLEWLYFWSMNISVPRSELVGRNLMFHEDWAEIGSEDVELGWRWAQAGNQIVYDPNAWGEHYHPHTLASACRLQESVGRGLRDLEVLVGDEHLLQRYGILSTRNEPRVVVRQLVRTALFNRWTVPVARHWLDSLSANNGLSRWMYWKVLLYYTTRGYRQAPARRPEPVPTLERSAA
jgi:glycosyltransferase involved in cell wall biosynthesis